MSRVCLCGESFRFLPRVAPEVGAVTICAECGRTYRYEARLVSIEWGEVEHALEGQPGWVLGGFEQVRDEAPNPNRLPRLSSAPRFSAADRAGTVLGISFALVLIVTFARLVWS